MKSIKFIYIIILSLLTVCGGVEFYKYSSESNNYQTKNIFLDSDTSQVESSLASMSCDIQMHFILKKKAKTRVEDSQNRILKNIYHTNFVGFRILKDRVIYGIASILKIPQHTHLHLYHLF